MSATQATGIRHPIYYFPNGSHVFYVDNTLYKLHIDLLTTHSGLIEDMFAIGNASVSVPAVEGGDDTKPIVLDVELRRAAFDLFLDHIHGRSCSLGADETYSHEELEKLLAFAHKYRCSMTRLFVIDHIWYQRFSYHPATLVRLGYQFDVSKFFRRGFKALLGIPLKQITKEHREQMGNSAFIALVYAKSVLEEHVRLIACEEPVILNHAAGCEDPTSCQEDWHNIWWSGMGRFLLDGRNPQPFDSAVKRFREMRFGRMSHGCQDIMFQLLDHGIGFRRADLFIGEICNGLV